MRARGRLVGEGWLARQRLLQEHFSRQLALLAWVLDREGWYLAQQAEAVRACRRLSPEPIVAAGQSVAPGRASELGWSHLRKRY